VSVSTTTSISGLPQESKAPRREPRSFRILEWGISLPVILLLSVGVFFSREHLSSIVAELLLWALLVLVSDFMPVQLWGDVVLSMSLPVLLAAGMVLAPLDAAIVAFLGSADIREFRGQTTFGRAIFNRSQVGLSVLAASIVFHGLHGDVERWPWVLAIAALSLLTDFVVNALLVAFGVALMSGVRIGQVLKNVHVGSPRLATGYACYGLVAVFLATAFVHVGNWALAGFLIPVLLARQMFSHGKRLREATNDLAAKTHLLNKVPSQIESERRDERLVLASALHDDVLQPLYKVHLMAQVLRQDLAAGKLFDLDDDLPELLRATEDASSSIRSLIRGLRHSSAAPSDLRATLHLFLDALRSETPAHIEESIDEIRGSPELQFLAYEIAREATTNAAKHSGARRISVRVFVDEGDIRVLVTDDGHGFDIRSVNQEEHFGLLLMRERAESAGGLLHVTSAPNGTDVVARIPLRGRG
jgi:signal transduction histidine kinase